MKCRKKVRSNASRRNVRYPFLKIWQFFNGLGQAMGRLIGWNAVIRSTRSSVKPAVRCLGTFLLGAILPGKCRVARRRRLRRLNRGGRLLRLICDRGFRFGLLFVLGIAFAFGIAACQPGEQTAISTEPLPYVEAVPDPQLPDWIEEISPLGQAAPLAQIRVRFAEPLIPLEALGNASQQDLLEKFALEPPLPGQFRFLTPRMVGFQAEQALPQATRLKVILKAGLADLNDHRLTQDLAWTFNTEPIELTNLPSTEPKTEWHQSQPLDLEPTLTIESNTALDLKSLQSHVVLVAEQTTQNVALNAALDETAAEWSDPSPHVQFDPSQQSWRYLLTPKQTLDRATDYRLEFSEGILPAAGNLPSDQVFKSQVSTYAPLVFEELRYTGGNYGRFESGLAQLQFNNSLNLASIDDNLIVNPPPLEAVPLVQAYEGDTYISLNPWAFDPGTTYQITIGPDLQDDFGQTLGERITLDYDTGDAVANIWAPDGLTIFPRSLVNDQDIALNVSAINLPNNQYQAVFKPLQPQDLINLDTDYPGNHWEKVLPNVSEWKTVSIDNATFNQTAYNEIPIRETLGSETGVLAYGIRARTYQYEQEGEWRWQEPSFYGLVELTNLGVFAQWFPKSGMVRVNHLDNGYPVGGAAVSLYVSDPGSAPIGNPTPCATGTTDATGTLNLDQGDLQQCYGASRALNDYDSAGPSLLVIVQEGDDWAFVQTHFYSGSYGFGTYTDWDRGQVLQRGVVFSDRQLYQPGETAWFTGVTHYLEEGEIKADANKSYRVTVTTPDGDEIDLGDRVTNNFGTFSIEWALSENQSLGFYNIQAQRLDNPADKYPIIYGEFQVAEFKPPNFKLDLSLDQSFAMANERVTAQAIGTYLFGAPLQGGEIQYFVTRQPLENYTTPGWDGFDFGRRWFWPEDPPPVGADVLQTQALLDEEGQATQEITVAEELPFPMLYRVDAEVQDVSNLSVGNSQTFTALPSDRLIGLRSRFVADAEQPFEVEVIVTDPKGQVVNGQNVTVQLEKMDYTYARRIVAGSESDQNQVNYTLVDEVSLRSGNQSETVKLTPPEPGAYRIRANWSNAKREATATDRQIWATGSGSVFWGQRDNDRLELKLDKETYKPGEMATVLIQSPYASGELYFSVIRDRPLYQQVLQVDGGAPEIRFQVTPDMLPNAAVEAVLVRQGESLSDIELGSVENLVRIGLQRFDLDLESQYLQVDIQPEKTELQPGEQETVRLKIHDQAGKPVQGQITLMVVNEAVLQLTGYRPPDLVEQVYTEQPIATRFDDNRLDVVLETPASPLAKGWGYGGGFSAGGADTRTRTDFRPLAYFNPGIVTDRNGEATVSFSLPDDLTTWRMMAVAIANQAEPAELQNRNWYFGNGEATVVTHLPLLANPLLPQFARPGDRLDLGIAVTNSTGERGQLEIEGIVGDALAFEDSRDQQKLMVKERIEDGTTAFRYPVTVTQSAKRATETRVNFAIQLDRTQDAFELPLSIRPLNVTEQVVESGVTIDRVTLPLTVDRHVDRTVGGLELSLASTLIPQIKIPARQVFDSDRLPLLEPIASQLLIAANLEVLSDRYGQSFAEFNPKQQASNALEALKTLQQPDGGFSFWPLAERSDPFVTPYAAGAIGQAQSAGFTVEPDLLIALRRYLNTLLTDPGQYSFCQDPLCKAEVRLESLMALAALGDRRSDFVYDIYEQRDALDPISRIQLARYLTPLPDWQAEAQSLAEELQEVVYETGRTAKLNVPRFWTWFNAQPVLQAQTLQLFVERQIVNQQIVARQARSELLDRLLQGLLALRQAGNWGCSYYNAQALNALVAYAETEPIEANFQTTATLVRQVLVSQQFNPQTRPSIDLVVPMVDLPRGKSELVLEKSGQGNLHYLVAYRYRLQGQQPGRYNGLRITRQIRPANEAVVLAQQGLFGDDQVLSVNSGQVFEIGLEIITDHPIDHLIITDPLPGGFEAVDTQFQTTIPYYQAQGDSWQLSYEQIYSDRVVAYGDHLEAGVYHLHYLVRSVTPGTFLWPGAEAHLQYAPEEFGRAISTTLEVKP